jgi:hypothetical protein
MPLAAVSFFNLQPEYHIMSLKRIYEMVIKGYCSNGSSPGEATLSPLKKEYDHEVSPDEVKEAIDEYWGEAKSRGVEPFSRRIIIEFNHRMQEEKEEDAA